MFRPYCLAIAAAILAVPATAADLRDTHEMITMPPGKLHAIAFRPLKPQACTGTPINPSGSRVEPVRPPAPGCETNIVALAKAD